MLRSFCRYKDDRIQVLRIYFLDSSDTTATDGNNCEPHLKVYLKACVEIWVSLGKDEWVASERQTRWHLSWRIHCSSGLGPCQSKNKPNEKLPVAKCWLSARLSATYILYLTRVILISSTILGGGVSILSGKTPRQSEHEPHHLVSEGAGKQRILAAWALTQWLTLF